MVDIRKEGDLASSRSFSNPISRPFLCIENLTKSFSQKTILENINLDVKQNEIFGIIGLSGAGKTTLLELLIGFLKPDEGDIKLRMGGLLDNASATENYISVRKNRDRVKSLFGFATQRPSFYDDLTIRENLEYFGEMYGIRKEVLQKNILTVLDLVGLQQQEHTLAVELSGGMQKRLDIACALVHNPKILILDEPTADLDIVLRKQMWELAKRINKNGTTIILASHFLDEIENLCTRIAILHDKKIVKQDSVQHLKTIYAENQQLHLLLKSENYGALIQHLQQQEKYPITKMRRDGKKLVIYSEKSEKLVYYLIHILEQLNEQIVDLYLNRPSLNEIFEKITSKVQE
jgi:ABC-2 type transport system ATP-binding protein